MPTGPVSKCGRWTIPGKEVDGSGDNAADHGAIQIWRRGPAERNGLWTLCLQPVLQVALSTGLMLVRQVTEAVANFRLSERIRPCSRTIQTLYYHG